MTALSRERDSSTFLWNPSTLAYISALMALEKLLGATTVSHCSAQQLYALSHCGGRSATVDGGAAAAGNARGGSAAAGGDSDASSDDYYYKYYKL